MYAITRKQPNGMEHKFRLSDIAGKIVARGFADQITKAPVQKYADQGITKIEYHNEVTQNWEVLA